MVILFHQTLMRNASVRTERFCRSFVTTVKRAVNSEKTLVVCFRVRKLQRRLRYYHTHNMLDTSKLTGTEDCMNFSSFKLRHFRCSHDFLSIFKADVPYCIANGRCWPFRDCLSVATRSVGVLPHRVQMHPNKTLIVVGY